MECYQPEWKSVMAFLRQEKDKDNNGPSFDDNLCLVENNYI